MEPSTILYGSHLLTPTRKFTIITTIVNALHWDIRDQNPIVYWYLSDVLNECESVQDLYGCLPLQLHRYVLEHVSPPKVGTPVKVLPTKEYHKKALEFINIRLTEMLLEE